MDGYSGSDIRLVCKEAAMRPVRKIFDALESHQEGRMDDTPSTCHVNRRPKSVLHKTPTAALSSVVCP